MPRVGGYVNDSTALINLVSRNKLLSEKHVRNCYTCQRRLKRLLKMLNKLVDERSSY